MTWHGVCEHESLLEVCVERTVGAAVMASAGDLSLGLLAGAGLFFATYGERSALGARDNVDALSFGSGWLFGLAAAALVLFALATVVPLAIVAGFAALAAGATRFLLVPRLRALGLDPAAEEVHGTARALLWGTAALGLVALTLAVLTRYQVA